MKKTQINGPIRRGSIIKLRPFFTFGYADFTYAKVINLSNRHGVEIQKLEKYSYKRPPEMTFNQICTVKSCQYCDKYIVIKY